MDKGILHLAYFLALLRSSRYGLPACLNADNRKAGGKGGRFYGQIGVLHLCIVRQMLLYPHILRFYEFRYSQHCKQ